ncbi:unnamed protein product [Phytophthora lilii]|uniref:Unnamed protein product n=1 Tax=Phytophthora lilii TaxID=2077276 RepID=A0A9W6TGR7_9STRA|nr:unnamed protein product [Phytophthora lilii]
MTGNSNAGFWTMHFDVEVSELDVAAGALVVEVLAVVESDGVSVVSVLVLALVVLDAVVAADFVAADSEDALVEDDDVSGYAVVTVAVEPLLVVGGAVATLEATAFATDAGAEPPPEPVPSHTQSVYTCQGAPWMVKRLASAQSDSSYGIPAGMSG